MRNFKDSIFTQMAALFCRLTATKAKFPSLTATACVQKYDFRRISAPILRGFILLFKPQLKNFAAKDAMSNFSLGARRLAVKNINKFDFKCFWSKVVAALFCRLTATKEFPRQSHSLDHKKA